MNQIKNQKLKEDIMKSIFRPGTSFIFMLFIVLCKVTGQPNDDKSNFTDNYINSLTKDTVNREPINFHAIVLFDPSGFITFGPAVYFEPAIGKYISVLAGIRVPNLGLITDLYTGNMNMAVTAHLSLRIYVKPRQKIDGFFLGPLIEYGRSNIGTGDDRNVRAFGGEIGYKFFSKKKLSLELSDNIGLIQSRLVKDPYELVYGSLPHRSWSNEMFVCYMLSLKIGIKF